MYKTYQLSILTDDGIIISRHYGIDGEPAEILAELWEPITKAETQSDLRKTIAEGMSNHNNPFTQAEALKNSIEIYDEKLSDTDEIPFDIEGAWYSDFVVIRNLTDRDFNLTSLRGQHQAICLYNGEGVILNLGEFYAGSDEDIARRKLIFDLEDLKENLWDSDANKNYSLIWNLCSDYDNEQRDGLYLTDIIQEAEFIDEYLLEDYFKNVLAKEPSLARLRHFIGDTYEDDLYKFDGYGNLANVDKDDFIEVIDNVQDKLLDAIEPEKPIQPQGAVKKHTARSDDACM